MYVQMISKQGKPEVQNSKNKQKKKKHTRTDFQSAVNFP